MLDFLGMYRQARTAHARQLTEGTFVSLGTSAMGGRDVCAQGALMRWRPDTSQTAARF